MATLQLREISKIFPDGTRLVNNLTLDARDGEMLVIVGPSGSGKTTILRMIAGLEAVSSGEIHVDGRSVMGLPAHRRNVAMVFQNYALYPHMTVRSNLDFPLRLQKQTKAHRDRRTLAVAEMLGLSDLLERLPSELSGGQQQRVAIGRSIVREPAISLMDEPLSNLDPPLRIQLRWEIARLQRATGITTVYVTHDQTEARILGDRIAVISQGCLQQIGEPHDLYRRPANTFVARFLGNPGMNVFRGKIRKQAADQYCLELGRVRVLVPVETRRRYTRFEEMVDQPILVGFRPEALSVGATGPDADCLRAKVAMVEALGHQDVLYLESPVPMAHGMAMSDGACADDKPPWATIAARCPSERSNSKRGEEVILRIDNREMTFFDTEGIALL